MMYICHMESAPDSLLSPPWRTYLAIFYPALDWPVVTNWLHFERAFGHEVVDVLCEAREGDITLLFVEGEVVEQLFAWTL